MAETPPPLPPRPRLSGEVLAFILSLIWLGLLVGAFRVLGLEGRQIADTLGLVVVALAVFLPIALIWLAVLVLRAARDMRDQSLQLQATVEGMRRGWIRDQQAAGLALKPTVEAKLDEISAAQTRTETQLALFTSRREQGRRVPLAATQGTGEGAGPDPVPDAAQPVLALDNPVPGSGPLPPADVIRALHFPETDSDEEGFAALRRALADHGTAELVRAAQTVLSVLAEEGIYMDDLRPDRARPELWRAFALGARGAEIAPLGGIRDRSCLALTAGRMRSDPAFREAAHRFLRTFDRRFVVFEAHASDAEIARLAETRSARAFMLLGRVAGMFG